MRQLEWDELSPAQYAHRINSKLRDADEGVDIDGSGKLYYHQLTDTKRLELLIDLELLEHCK